MPEARPYQARAIDALRAAKRAGHRRILFSLATGGGKSVIASFIVSEWVKRGGTVLAIAHRREILSQLRLHFERQGLRVGMILAGEPEDRGAPVQVASIASLVRRNLPPATMVLVDEAHRAPAESYVRVLEQYPNAFILGLTATPCRLDGKPLKDHYDVLVEGPAYSELMSAGAIARPIVYAPRQRPDLTEVGVVAGDFNQRRLEGAMRRPHVIGNIVREWQSATRWPERKVPTVLFAVGVEHSRECAELFQMAGIPAGHLDGDTPDEERLSLQLALESGEIAVLCNVGVLCEGWDQPRVKCCVMACPTLSLTKFMQCVGRILRPFGDQAPIVLDHGDNVRMHGLPHEDREWSLEEGTAKPTQPATHRMCPWCYAYVERNPCELCGHETEVKKREVRKVDGVMSRIDAAIERDRNADPKRAYFDKQLDKARHEGFKPGYAAAKYKEKFGEWPPWDWSQRAKDSLTPEWEEAIRQREAKRLMWQGRMAQKTAALGTDVTPEEDEAFWTAQRGE